MKVNRYLVRVVGTLSLSLSTMLMGRVNAPSSIPPVEVEQGNPSDTGRKGGRRKKEREKKAKESNGRRAESRESRESREQ